MSYKNSEKPFMESEKRGDDRRREDGPQGFNPEFLGSSSQSKSEHTIEVPVTHRDSDLSSENNPWVDEDTGMTSDQIARVHELVSHRVQGQSERISQEIDEIFNKVDLALSDENNTADSGHLRTITRAVEDGVMRARKNN